jgi:hypothetical protein
MLEATRKVIYVYSQTTVFVGSAGRIGMLWMDSGYGNNTYSDFRNNADNVLGPGVYGILSELHVELKLRKGSGDDVIVRADVLRKDPWPDPPPPPPGNFGKPADWPKHLESFMVPLGYDSTDVKQFRIRWADRRETYL